VVKLLCSLIQAAQRGESEQNTQAIEGGKGIEEGGSTSAVTGKNPIEGGSWGYARLNSKPKRKKPAQETPERQKT